MEFEYGEKGIGDGLCFYGFKDGDDIVMYEWNGIILGFFYFVFENRIFSLSIYCGDNYLGKLYCLYWIGLGDKWGEMKDYEGWKIDDM